MSVLLTRGREADTAPPPSRPPLEALPRQGDTSSPATRLVVGATRVASYRPEPPPWLRAFRLRSEREHAEHPLGQCRRPEPARQGGHTRHLPGLRPQRRRGRAGSPTSRARAHDAGPRGSRPPLAIAAPVQAPNLQPDSGLPPRRPETVAHGLLVKREAGGSGACRPLRRPAPRCGRSAARSGVVGLGRVRLEGTVVVFDLVDDDRPPGMPVCTRCALVDRPQMHYASKRAAEAVNVTALVAPVAGSDHKSAESNAKR